MTSRLLPLTAFALLSFAAPAGAAETPHEMTPPASAPAGGAGACVPSGELVAVAARDVKFDKDCLAVAAGEPFTLAFDNQEAVDHNVEILPAHGAPDPLFTGKIFKGPKTVMYPVGALPAGTYHFHCELHPVTMVGTFLAVGPDGATSVSAAAGKAGDSNGDRLVLLASVLGIAVAVGGIAFLTGAEYGRSRAAAAQPAQVER